MNDIEKQQVIDRITQYIDLKAVLFGKSPNGVLELVKRDPMYGGNGVVYMLSLFDSSELVNNRFAQYMILLDNGDEAGFHEHGERKEQEVYCIVHGEGEYCERVGEEKITRKLQLKKGNLTVIQGPGNYHSIINTGDEPLIIFVIATNEPK
jgi:mannose-6-phosphate isomerase-like protein (cupin superfamily)